MENKKAKELAGQITDYVNAGGRDCGQQLAAALSLEHRTLQQSTIKTFLEFIEFAATEHYRTDGRNEGAQKTAKRLMKGFVKVIAEEENLTEEQVLKNWNHYRPSKWLPLI